MPKGEYQFIAKFTPPYKKIATALSVFGFFIWVLFVYYVRRNENDNKTRII